MCRTQATLFVSAVLGLAANACAAHTARPVVASNVVCPGATLRSAAEVESYAACNVVEGDLTIAASDVSDLSALAGLRQVTGTLTISNNSDLDDLSGLDALTQAGRLVIRENGIYTARGLEQLSRVGDLVIENNHKLISLAGVSSLTQARSVTIQYNPVLSAMGMLPALADVATPMQIRANRCLSLGDTERWLARTRQGGASVALAQTGVRQSASNR